MFQLCSRDEYGATAILATEESLDAVVEIARKHANEDNMNNALTDVERLRDFEISFPQFFTKGTASKKVVYGGLDTTGRHTVLVASKEGVEQKPITEAKGDLQFYLGTHVSDTKNDVFEDFYVKDHKDNMIDDFADQLLEGKTLLFIKEL